MPEGDAIFRTARTLYRALAGKPIVRFESMLPALTRVHDDNPLTGRTIDDVTSVGKHVLMRFSGSFDAGSPFDSGRALAQGRPFDSGRALAQGKLVLRTHMRMNGSWHIYRPGERWRRPRRDMRLVVATADFEAVGFNIPVAEFIREQDLSRHDELRRLGPDLLSSDFDEAAAIAGIRSDVSREIADVLLDQRVLAGIGNVYKSEALFACGVNPFAAAGTLDEQTVRQIVQAARKFLRANVSPGLAAMTTYTGYRRTTRRDDRAERLWVYGRAGLPCRRCGRPIQVRKHGPHARVTYWCGTCQS